MGCTSSKKQNLHQLSQKNHKKKHKLIEDQQNQEDQQQDERKRSESTGGKTNASKMTVQEVKSSKQKKVNYTLKSLVIKDIKFSSVYTWENKNCITKQNYRFAQHNRLGIQKAVQIIKKSIGEEKLRQHSNELSILKDLDHPNILKFYEVYEDNLYYYVVEDFCPGGTLIDQLDQLKKLSEVQLANLMLQILRAVQYLHQNSYIHRNICPQSIYFTEKSICSKLLLSNFKFCIASHHSNSQFQFGDVFKQCLQYKQIQYQSPQVIKGGPADEKNDIWSCGVMLYFLLSGRLPFKGEDQTATAKNIIRGKIDLESYEWENVSNEAKDLLQKLLNYNSSQRPKAVQCLKHKWFKLSSQMDKQLASTALMNLKNYCSKFKLQKALLVYIHNTLGTNEEKANLMKIFQSLDTDNNGKLSKQELLNGYKQILGEQNAIIQVEKIFEQVDENQSDEIDYSEFVMATIDQKKLLSDDRLVQAFHLIDQDGNGTISKQEMKRLLSDSKIKNSEFTEMMNEIDQNKDGAISLAEFIKIMKKIYSQ